MGTNSYRLWQVWQQMKYPSRGLPGSEGERGVLIRIDGTVGPIFERRLRRRPKPETLSVESRRSLERCQRQLGELLPTLSGEARRYFDRVEVLIRLVLAEG